MCDPVTMTMAAMTAVGKVQQGRAAKKQADAQSAMDENQARMARADAEAEASRIRRAGREARGSTVAAIAASGAKIGEWSALEFERQVMTDYETDAAIALLTGDRQGDALETQAKLTRAAGRDARNAAYLSAATSLLSAGARTWNNTGSKWVGGSDVIYRAGDAGTRRLGRGGGYVQQAGE